MSIFNQSNPTPHPSAQVLVIEDDSGVQQLIETVLRRHGFSVLLAGTGRIGLRQVHERRRVWWSSTSGCRTSTGGRSSSASVISPRCRCSC